MRRAEWRRRADDPTGLLGWWWQGLVKRRALVFALWLLGLVLWLLSWSAVMVWIGGWVWLPLGLGLLAVFGNPFQSRDTLSELLPVPAPEGQFRVSVEYRKNGLVTGRDEMALCMVDGWLVAEGVRSHFALRPEDIVFPNTSWRRGQFWLRLETGDEILLQGGDKDGLLNLDRWRRFKEPVEGEPTFPPAGAHPQEMARWNFWGSLGMGLIFVPNMVATYLHLGGQYAEVRLFFGLLAFGLAWFAGRRFFRLGEITIAARREEALAGQVPPLPSPAEEVRDVRVR